jgi:mannose-1-phosphate guanylyltransferase/mannose-1-phosphate guanylyltransferase/mannose-6-phosphate isomerase
MGDRIIPVILSGGAGTRLWPLSRAARPKQMLSLAGGKSMLRLTAERLGAPDLFERPIVVTGSLQGIAEEVGLARFIVEPAARNTAPAVALATFGAADDDLLLVLPSDHLVTDVEAFRDAVRRARPFAEQGWIVTFGMKPDRAETGYGYVERGGALGSGVFAAARFVEKPDAATAAAFVAGGRHDWNGGMFLFRAGRMADALRSYAPEVAAAAVAALAEQSIEDEIARPAEKPFLRAPAVSIDVAVMEKADRIAVVPVAMGWSDIGSFAALAEATATDDAGNAMTGDVIAIDAGGCLIRSEGPLVAAIGIRDLIVVATADAVLIVPKDQSQRVKEVVERLKSEGRDALT